MDLKQLISNVKDDMEQVDHLIRESLFSKVSLVNDVSGYIINSGGKRLRPLLVILTGRACQQTAQQPLVSLAAIIEFIHTATLLHDDVVDESRQRRGKDTANQAWDNSAAVLVGDFLYSRAFQMMVKLNNHDIMQVMADATNTIAEGEVLQLMHQYDQQITEESYLKVIDYKTATLFSAAAKCSAILAKQQEAIINCMAEYGYNLGMAYQLIDDVLDYAPNSQDIGKNVGDDIAQGKATLPIIYLLKHGSTQQKQLATNALTKGKVDFAKLQTAVLEAGGIEYTSKLAEQYAKLATDNLTLMKELASKNVVKNLVEITEFIVQRNY